MLFHAEMHVYDIYTWQSSLDLDNQIDQINQTNQNQGNEIKIPVINALKLTIIRPIFSLKVRY